MQELAGRKERNIQKGASARIVALLHAHFHGCAPKMIARCAASTPDA
jgi:hypothetical protein